METGHHRTAALVTAAAAAVMIFELAIPEPAEARGARARAASSMARSGGFSRPAPRPTRDIPASRDFDRQARDVNRDINRDLSREFDGDVGRSIDRDRDINRELDRSIDRDIDMHRDIDIDVDDGWDDGWGDHPVAAGAAFGTAAAATSAAIGSWVYALPPSCAHSPYYGYSYYQCGGVWYEPQYSGTQITYVVVDDPTYAGGSSDGPSCPDPYTDDPRCVDADEPTGRP